MNNNLVVVSVIFADKKRVNNMEVPVVCCGKVTINLDRRFLSNLEKVVCTFKELGNVDITFGECKVATLEKDGYTITGTDKVEFQRFGGKIQKDFLTAIDDRISELEEQ